jgi:putative photosynthetic complex assembly protein
VSRQFVVTGDDHITPVPRGMLIAAAVLLVFAVGATLFSRATGIGRTQVAPVAAAFEVALQFVDDASGAVHVMRVPDGVEIASFAPGTNGFGRGVVRGLVRDHLRAGLSAAATFRLVRWADGRMSLGDPATGERIELDVFGPTNAAVFAAILKSAESGKQSSP